MKNKAITHDFKTNDSRLQELPEQTNSIHTAIASNEQEINSKQEKTNEKPGILIISSYPPRECGIATYSQDLITALNNKFSQSFSFKVCALESDNIDHTYPEVVKYVLKTSEPGEYEELGTKIKNDDQIKVVLLQHEFGFYNLQEEAFVQFLKNLSVPIIIVFHTVLPHPEEKLRSTIQLITGICNSVIVMTRTSANILITDYSLSSSKISIIAHGTHLVPHLNEKTLKTKYSLDGRKVLTTFGLLSSGKGIKTTLDALPAIIKQNPETIFLIIGKTHPEVLKAEGEKYRGMLQDTVKKLHLEEHVRFINRYLPLAELLEYLQLTDIYLFTANDPNQAVSGTFAYAMSCACPIISTPIPHAIEVLNEDTGIIFDFGDSLQLADAVIRLFRNEQLRRNMSLNSLQKTAPTVWENSAVAHAMLLDHILNDNKRLKYTNPDITLNHLKRMTTEIGIIQFSKINQPDINSGYTLDDNARALIVMCKYYKLTGDTGSIKYIWQYLNFIKHCQQPDGDFLNYVDRNNQFTNQNNAVNLDDSNGRVVWALGYLLSMADYLPAEIISEADKRIEKTFRCIDNMHSTRAMAFSIKGLSYYHRTMKSPENLVLITTLANRLAQMYKHESEKAWEWFESYLTYANSILPEAMLYAWVETGDAIYKEIALKSFNFLMSQIFNENGIEVISNKNWLQKGQESNHFGEQPIDVAYTIMTLSKFYDVFQDENYRQKMKTAFNWFLGDNRLHQIIYNPCTGGCYDGLEEMNVNLNQGAESIVSYLMARLTIENYAVPNIQVKAQLRKHVKVPHLQEKPIYSTDSENKPIRHFPFQIS